jgi:ATP citrate (pro-S)-lyase
LRAAGAFVPESYEGFGVMIGEVFQSAVGTHIMRPHTADIEKKLAIIKHRRATRFSSTISDERGEELLYNKIPVQQFVQDGSLGKVIGHLWLKKELPDYAARFIETVLILLADHGPAVSGATNTIITARAGKDLVTSLIAGLTTIGPRF